MKNKLPCEIIRDLLPSYVDGLTSEVTNEAICEHIKSCDACKETLHRMQAPEEIESEEEQEKEKKYESLLDRRQMTEETWVQIAKQYSQTDAEEMQMRLERDLEAIAAAKQLKKTAEKFMA